MNKTLAFRKTIRGILEPFCPAVAHGDASDSSAYPRIAYETRELLTDYDRVLVELEVNLIDHGNKETWVEDTADEIQKTFDRYYHLDTDIQFASYIGQRLIVREDDKDIKRRRLTFEIHLYERG